MVGIVIIIFCLLVLSAYVFDLISSRFRIPSVILLLGLGWALQQLVGYLGVTVPDVSGVLPILGTVGLILIVLEGALELEFSFSRFEVILKSSLMALIPIFVFAMLLSYVGTWFGFSDFRQNLLNITPLCVISSAIAIPTAQALSTRYRDFVVYESSLSDILGILLFNFLLENTYIGVGSFVKFSFHMVLIVVISLVATFFLAILMNKITHHIKYMPIVFCIILIYEISKEYDLPGLVFILIFGLFLGNIQRIKRVYLARLGFVNLDELTKETHKFKDQVSEATFLVRSLFFILFGYLIDNNDLFDESTLPWSLGICLFIFGLRAILLKVLRLPLSPLFYIAPRGLITILLFMSIPAKDIIPFMNSALVIQVVVITAFVMMFGMLSYSKKPGELLNGTEDRK